MPRTFPLLSTLQRFYAGLTGKGGSAPADSGLGTLTMVPFAELADAWRKRCAAFPFRAGTPNGRRVAVLVTPWLGTPVPFFNLEIVRALAAAGDDVEVIFDRCNVFGNAPNAAENQMLEETLQLLPPWLRVTRMNETDPVEADEQDDRMAAHIIRENAVWRTRGESTAQRFVDRKLEARTRLPQHLARIRALLASRRFAWLLVPGGIWGLSGAYVWAAARTGIAFTTYDAGGGVVLAQQGIAAHQTDLPRALELTLEQLTEPGRARMIAWARGELQERRQGRGNYTRFQAVAATGTPSGDPNVFVPLNLRWDAAALGRARLFPSVKEWITAIVRWAATEPLARVCIRQHPVERHQAFRTSDDIGALIREINTAGDRVRFVAADDPVNSYDLLGQVRALLPYSSSMATEAPMLGIPVITSAHNYYENFSFVNRAESPEHYFALVSRALRGELRVAEPDRDLAAVVYCLVQHCNIMPTGFTATPTAFMEWVKVPPDELWQRPEVQDLHRALRTGLPLAFIRAQRFVSVDQPAAAE